MPAPMKAAEKLIFLQALREGGIESLYLPRKKDTQVSAEPAAFIESTHASAQSVREQMLALRDITNTCMKCPELCATRNKVVFGSGNIQAKLVFVGEAPGADEDEQGLPFVGRAGQLLTKMIEAMQMTRKDVFICNVLKCRPPGNRPPEPAEKTNCKPYLFKQLELIKPEIVVALGTHAAQSLLETETPISRLRGQVHEFAGAKLVCTFHPSYLLRNPSAKKDAWEDLQKVMALLSKPE